MSPHWSCWPIAVVASLYPCLVCLAFIKILGCSCVYLPAGQNIYCFAFNLSRTTYSTFTFTFHFKRVNINNNKHAALQQRVTRKVSASALFPTAPRCKVFLLCSLSLCCTPATATTTAAMDLFTFYSPSSVLICKPCGYAVPPTTLSTHIKVHYLYNARYAATNYFDTS